MPADEARFHQGAFTARLSCAALQGKYGPPGIETGSVTAEATGCPEKETERADALRRLMDDLGTVQAVVEGNLVLMGPNGLHARLARIPGTAGPTDPALGEQSAGLLGRWRIETIDGRAPAPGFDPDRMPFLDLGPFAAGAYTGCNSGGTDVLWGRDQFEARGPVEADAMGCGALGAQESRTFRVLVAGPTFRLEGDRLRVLVGGEEVMALSRMADGQAR